MREIKLEIFESGCGRHPVGETFTWNEDTGKMCPWLLDSANVMIRILEYGGKLPWKYSKTKYEKVINKDGVTTEFIRCPDPTTSGVVLKIIATEKRASEM